MKNLVRSIVTFCALLFSLSACEKDPALSELAIGPGIDCSFQLNTTSAMNGQLIVNDVYLNLAGIELNGEVGEEVKSFTRQLPEPEGQLVLTREDPNQPVHLDVTPGIYSSVHLILQLFQDTYQLVLSSGSGGGNDGGGNGGGGNDGGGNGGGGNGGGGNGGGGNGGGGNGGGGNGGGGNGGGGNGDDDDDDNDGGGNDDDDDNDGGGNDDDDDNDGGGNDDDDDDKGKGKDKDKDKDKDDDDDWGNNDDDGKGKDKDKDKDKEKDKGKDKDKDGDDDNRNQSSTVDLADYLQNAHPSMLLIGTYLTASDTLRVLLAIDGILSFSLAGSDSLDTDLSNPSGNRSYISFNPEYWFAPLTPEDISAASIQTYQEGKVLFIHKNFNQELFNVISQRIEESTTLMFGTSEE